MIFLAPLILRGAFFIINYTPNKYECKRKTEKVSITHFFKRKYNKAIITSLRYHNCPSNIRDSVYIDFRSNNSRDEIHISSSIFSYNILQIYRNQYFVATATEVVGAELCATDTSAHSVMNTTCHHDAQNEKLTNPEPK